MNEETVKATIILPWLADRGIVASEVQLETSFSVRIGRQFISIGEKSAADRVHRARLDILVCRNNRNLFVIEVKRSSAELSEEDRDQAISYAKLVDPIAPFAAVTNGEQFLVYDTITKSDVNPDRADLLSDRPIQLPEESRLEALRLFFGRSPTNLLRFCQAQVEREVRTIRGDASHLGAVYVPEIQVERSEALLSVRTFLTSDKPMFVVLGDSGMGKTCLMIDVANMLLESQHPTLFFKGTAIGENLPSEIGHEVEWAFGDTASPIAMLRRLSANTAGRPLVIVVDGLEDWIHPTRVQSLVWLASHIVSQPVRLIVSCKPGSWQHFREIRGLPTGIETSIYDSDTDKPYTAELGPFSDREFSIAVTKYRTVFKVGGVFEDTALDAARRSPFLLRLLFQVSASTGSRNLTFESTEFFKEYLNMAIRRTSNPEAAEMTLDAVARIMYERDAEWVDKNDVRKDLKLGINESVLPDLFENQLLVETDSHATKRIGFGFGQLRNYIIAFRVHKWPECGILEFTHESLDIPPYGLRSEVLSFYYPFAADEQKRVLDGTLREHALKYLNLYREILKTYFQTVRNAFSPQTEGGIGFVGELSLDRRVLGAYGFRPINENEEEILFLPVQTPFKSNKLSLAGAKNWHYAASAGGFRSLNIGDEVLLHEVCPQLKDIVEKGYLDESAAPALPQELVIKSVESNPKIFGTLLENGTVRYPLLLKDVAMSYQRELLRRHFHEECVTERRMRGEIPEHWSGGVVSYSPSLTPEDLRRVEVEVESALEREECIEFRVKYVELERMWYGLRKAIRELEMREASIERAPLPLLKRLASVHSNEMSYDAFRQHCKLLVELALESYKGIVETNFPMMKECFSLYAQMPFRAVIAMSPDVQGGTRLAQIYFCKSKGPTNEVVCYETKEIREEGNFIYTPAGVEEWVRWETASVRTFSDGPARGRLGREQNAVIRRWVYNWLHKEISHAEQFLLTAYGVSKQRD